MWGGGRENMACAISRNYKVNADAAVLSKGFGPIKSRNSGEIHSMSIKQKKKKKQSWTI